MNRPVFGCVETEPALNHHLKQQLPDLLKQRTAVRRIDVAFSESNEDHQDRLEGIVKFQLPGKNVYHIRRRSGS